MTVQELNDVLVHWQGWEDRDYEIFLWDPNQQHQIKFTFCGCSHPDKTVNFVVTGYGNIEETQRISDKQQVQTRSRRKNFCPREEVPGTGTADYYQWTSCTTAWAGTYPDCHGRILWTWICSGE